MPRRANNYGTALNRVKALNTKADKFFESGNFNSAVSAYLKSIKLCGSNPINSKFELCLADAYNGMGHTLRSKYQFNKSKRFQTKALTLYKRIASKNPNLRPKLAISLHYMGDILADLKDLDKSLSNYKEELKIARQLYSENRNKHLNLLVHGLNGIAYRLADKKDFNGAISYFSESLKCQKRTGKKRKDRKKVYPNLSWTYHGIGTTLLKKNDLNGAIQKLKKALAMREEIASHKNMRYVIALKNTLYKLGEAYSKKNAPREAKKYFGDALRIVKDPKYKKQVSSSKAMAEKRQIQGNMEKL